MKGIIVLDGPDGTGKSTLAQKFVTDHGAKLFHQTYRFKKCIPAYHEAMVRRAEKVVEQGGLAVLDRLWITEAVYAAVFRGGTTWPQYTYDMAARIKELGGVTVLCLAQNIDECIKAKHERDATDEQSLDRERVVNNGKSYDNEQLRELHLRFKDLWRGNMWTEGPDYASMLTRTGGVNEELDYLRYVIQEDGVDLDKFAKQVLKRLKMARKMRGLG